MESNAAKGPVDCVGRNEVVQLSNEMKTEKAPGPSEVSFQLVAASTGVGIQVMAVLCQRILDGLGMPAEWFLIIVVPIYKVKGDIMKCSCYGAVKLHGPGMMMVEMALRGLRGIVTDNEMQVDFAPDNGRIYTVLIKRR